MRNRDSFRTSCVRACVCVSYFPLFLTRMDPIRSIVRTLKTREFRLSSSGFTFSVRSKAHFLVSYVKQIPFVRVTFPPFFSWFSFYMPARARARARVGVTFHTVRTLESVAYTHASLINVCRSMKFQEMLVSSRDAWHFQHSATDLRRSEFAFFFLRESRSHLADVFGSRSPYRLLFSLKWRL